jgi:hypothetical protein
MQAEHPHNEHSGIILKTLDFGNEAGDDVDPSELLTYFVEQQNFRHFLDRSKRLLVATARKGVGKSALLKWTAHRVSQTDPSALVIHVRGSELVRSNFNLQSELKNPSDYQRDWMVRLCALVNRRLALQINLALTDDKITLVETAELEGYKSRNLAGALIDRMTSFFAEKGRTSVKLPGACEHI